jgi:hypothetical protein
MTNRSQNSMLAASQVEVASTRFSRVSTSGQLVWRTEFLGPPPSPVSSDSLAVAGAIEYREPGPGEVRPAQAFLVEQEAGAVVPPHFHFVDQFQVVVAGDGKLGAHAVQPLAVHFAGASTGYGPITPGDSGLSYFTFRASADETGAQYLPGARPRMRPLPKRNVIAPRILVGDPGSLTEGALESSLEKDDGLGVFYMRIPPNGAMATPSAAEGNGMSMLVAAGALTLDGGTYAPWSCLFVAPEEGSATLQASGEGAEVLVLRYPRVLTS